MSIAPIPPRLFVIRARKVPFAVIFRRGPSKQVRLIGWNTEDDTFQGGQWLKGRIYERRCDLSPNGKYLLYFAANQKPPFYSWTAISKPPWLTAISLWPKGDCWGGGGLFESANTVWLNHPPYQSRLAPNFQPRPRLKVTAEGGQGEDFPIYAKRLIRDGWKRKQIGVCRHWRKKETTADSVEFCFDPPEIWEHRADTGDRLKMVIHGVGERNGTWYQVTHDIVSETAATVELGRTDWADWDRNGDLLYAADGKLFRLPRGKDGRFDPARSLELIDFSPDRFKAMPPPDWAKAW